jgi:uncharacterized membrane protein
MQQKIKPYFPFIIIFIIAAVFLRSFFQSGFPQTHDGEMHIARTANFYLGLKDLQIPVRWAPNLNYRFGYPVFHFNYPLFYLLPAPLYLFGCSWESSMKIVLFITYFLAGCFFYLWQKKHAGKKLAGLGAVFYLVSPYFMIDFFIRGSYGEVLAMALFPAVLYFFDRFLVKTNWKNLLLLFVSSLSLALSHNIFVMLFGPFLLIYVGWQGYKKKKLVKGLIAVGLGYLASFFFWLPALWEKKFVNLSAFSSKFYLDHFVYLQQLVTSSWQYGFSTSGPNDTMPLLLGWPAVAVIVLSFVFLCFSFLKKRKVSWSSLVLFTTTLFLIFFMTGSSRFIWQLVPLLGYIQYPWRLIGLASFFTAALFVVMMRNFFARKNKWVAIIFAIFAIGYGLFLTNPFDWNNKEDVYYMSFPFTSSTRHENMPIWFDQSIHLDFDKDFYIASASAELLVRKSNRQELIINNASEENQTLLLRQAYFPGWEAWLDHRKAAIDYENDDYPGLITLDIPPGEHELVVKFTENTPARIVGDSLSLLALASIAGWAWVIRRRK